MKIKKLENGIHCVEYSLMNLSDHYKELLEKQFNYLEDYKNGFIKYMNSKIWELRKENKEFDDAMREIAYIYSKKGRNKIANIDERSKRLKDAYDIIGKFISETDLLDEGKRRAEYVKTVDPIYYLWIPDESRTYATKHVMSAYNTFFFGKGKSVHAKEYGHTQSIQYRPMHAVSKKDGSVVDRIQSPSRIVFIDGIPKYETWDLEELEELEKSEDYKKGTRHRYRTFDLYYNVKDDLQKYLVTNPYLGATKLTRYWKKGKWRYRVQINFEKVSPAVESMNNEHHKVGIDFGTQTVAWVRDDGEQGIIELSPNTPRVTERIKELDRYLCNSRRAVNPLYFDEKGTGLSEDKMKEVREEWCKEHKGEEFPEWRNSNRYLKAVARRKEAYRYLREKRKLNNLKTSKQIFELGDEFYTENNSFVAWGIKRCRMAEKTAEKYDNGVRKSDYTKLIHDRAVGSVDARLSLLASQKDMNYVKLKSSSDINCSTYNHFTDKNDLFEKLNERLIVFDTNTVGEDYEVSDFDETIQDVKVDNRYYILQRDLYAAAKMLFFKPVQKTIKTSLGKEKTVTSYEFDKKGFKKFFDTKFYPKHEEYIMKLRKEKANGSELNGTIFGSL